ncbi:DUF418 domain-containing protein [Luteibaculum oceani]|uniref:DUF418 domain-containing protein n=1 Tax=Luteibaculum oceani TaxID=1294296 RepID=A0A5C6V9Y6_9FLAO|nr:DUF418 domain-containing protein [Luteibaculum oceani]TXC82027.1 DUF418 domain-containing protein [Luteibaculum oceani]
MSTTISPIPEQGRIHYLDVLRGIAIFFIFIANIVSFSGLFFISPEEVQAFSHPQLNSVLQTFTSIFVDGKFYSIFSILFGIGFVIQQRNAEKVGVNFNWFFSKRMLGLLFLGLLHLYLWYGDIVHLYAIMGFFLIPFKRIGNSNLLRWAVVLTFLPVLHYIAMNILNAYYPYEFFKPADAILIGKNYPTLEIVVPGMTDPVEIINMLEVLKNADTRELLGINVVNPLYRWGSILLEGRLFKILACFLIGIWAGRKILDADLLSNRSLLTRIGIWGGIIGILFTLIQINLGSLNIPGPADVWYALAYAFAVIPLACGIAALIALWWNPNNQFLNIFKPIGKAALSNYFFQSVISVFYFYGAGLGKMGQYQLWENYLFVIVVFAFQIVFTSIWLKYFRYGPVEWIWRSITYGRWIKMTK